MAELQTPADAARTIWIDEPKQLYWKITDRAIAALRKIRQEHEIPEEYGVRIGVRRRFMARPQFTIAFDVHASASDRIFEVEEFRFFIDPAVLPQLHGVTVDYVERPDATGFTFLKDPSAYQPVQDEQREKIVITGGSEELITKIIQALKNCYDPEIPIDIYELGLIYEIHIDDANNVAIKMTLTAPACPAAEILPADVERHVRSIPEVNDVTVEVVFDPPWSKDRISEVGKLELGML